MTTKREPTAEEWACSRAIQAELRELKKPMQESARNGLTEIQIHVVINVALTAIMAMHDEMAEK